MHEHGLIRGLCVFEVLLICFDSITQCIQPAESHPRLMSTSLWPGFMACNEFSVESSEGES